MRYLNLKLKKIVRKSGPYFFKKNFSRFDKKVVKNKFSNYSRNQYMHTLFLWNNDKSFKKIFKN